MPDPFEPTYSQAFPALTGIYLEDSWVLAVTPADDGCEFRLEAVLTPEHPRYRPPAPGEQHCYEDATLTLTSASPISFQGSNRPPATDATGQRDWGNIDTFEPVDWEGRDAWLVQGDWGELTVVQPNVRLALLD